MGSRYARTVRLAQQVALRPPFLTGIPTLAQPARYKICDVKPMFPTDSVDFEESGDYCGDYEKIGDLVKKPGYGQHTLEFERLTFADAAILAEIWAQGGVFPSGADPYTFVHNSASVTELARLAAEVGVPVGEDTFVKVLQNGMAESIEINGSSDATFVKAILKVRGSETQRIAAFSGQESDTHDEELIRHGHLNLYIDDAPGDIGTTLVSCNRLSFKISLSNEVDTVQVDCGPINERQARFAELELRFVLDTLAAGQYDAYESQAIRYIRLEAISPSSGQTWQFDLVGRFHKYSHGTSGPLEDMTLMAKSQRDDTLGYSWQQTCIVDGLDFIQYYGLFFDGFTDTNGVDLSAHTPNYDKLGDGYAATHADFEIQSNRLTSSANTNTLRYATVDTGEADVTMATGVLFNSSTSGSVVGLIARLTDASNHWRVVLNYASQLLQIIEVVSGTPTVRGSVAVPLVTGRLYFVEAKFDGDQVTAKVDGREASYSGAGGSATEHGVAMTFANVCDNFWIA